MRPRFQRAKHGVSVNGEGERVGEETPATASLKLLAKLEKECRRLTDVLDASASGPLITPASRAPVADRAPLAHTLAHSLTHESPHCTQHVWACLWRQACSPRAQTSFFPPLGRISDVTESEVRV